MRIWACAKTARPPAARRARRASSGPDGSGRSLLRGIDRRSNMPLPGNTKNDPIRLDLMKHVERAVRPVVAPSSHRPRCAMSCGALGEVYEQEVARDGDAVAPRSAPSGGSASRVRSPRSSKATVSRSARWQGRLSAWELPPAGEGSSATRCGNRWGRLCSERRPFSVRGDAARESAVGHVDDPPFSIPLSARWFRGPFGGIFVFTLLHQGMCTASKGARL